MIKLLLRELDSRDLKKHGALDCVDSNASLTHSTFSIIYRLDCAKPTPRLSCLGSLVLAYILSLSLLPVIERLSVEVGRSEDHHVYKCIHCGGDRRRLQNCVGGSSSEHESGYQYPNYHCKGQLAACRGRCNRSRKSHIEGESLADIVPDIGFLRSTPKSKLS